MQINEFQKKLKQMQNKLEKDKEEKTRLEWEQDKIQKELKEKGFSSIEDAQKEIKKIDKKINFIEKKIQKSIAEFKENHGEYFGL